MNFTLWFIHMNKKELTVLTDHFDLHALFYHKLYHHPTVSGVERSDLSSQCETSPSIPTDSSRKIHRSLVSNSSPTEVIIRS